MTLAPIADMRVEVNYRRSDNVVMFQEVRTIKASEATNGEVVVAADPSKFVGWSIDGIGEQTIDYQTGERVAVNFNIVQNNYSLTVASDAVAGGYQTTGAPASAKYGDTVTLTVTATDNTSGKQPFTSCEVAGIPATVRLVRDGDDSTTPAEYAVTFTMPAQDLNIGTGAISNWQL